MANNKIITKVRVNKKTGQKTANIPKSKKTENWEEEDLLELNLVETKKVKIK